MADDRFTWQKQGATKTSGDIAKSFRNETLSGHTAHLHRRGATTAQQTAAIFARETIQNSFDSHLELARLAPHLAPRLTVTFRFVHLYGSSKARMVEALGLDQVARHCDEAEWNPTDGPSRETLGALRRAVGSGKDPLVLLYVEEDGAAGMYTYGDHPGDCKMIDAGHSTNHSNKAEGSGGSFGAGKAVNAAGSQARMVFMYSTYPWVKDGIDGGPDPRYNRHTSKLSGSVYLPLHRHQGQHYTGVGYHDAGAAARAAGNDVIIPHLGETADRLAEKLGMRREPGSNGSSLLIVGPAFGPDDLHEACNHHWWPAITDGRMRLQVTVDVEGAPRDDAPASPGTVDPTRLDATSGFVTAYQKLDDEPDARCEAGAVALTVVPSTVRPGVDEQIAEGKKVNSHHIVARVRNTGMVIRYDRITTASNIPGPGGTREIRGVFRAEGDAVCDLLRRGEPKTHDDWIRNPNHLAGRELARYRGLLTGINTTLRESVRDLAIATAGADATESKPSQLLAELLGDITRPDDSPRRRQARRSRQGGTSGLRGARHHIDEQAGTITLRATLVSRTGAPELRITPRYQAEGDPDLRWDATRVTVGGEPVTPDGGTYPVALDGGQAEIEITVDRQQLPAGAPALARVWEHRLSCLWAL